MGNDNISLICVKLLFCIECLNSVLFNTIPDVSNASYRDFLIELELVSIIVLDKLKILFHVSFGDIFQSIYGSCFILIINIKIKL